MTFHPAEQIRSYAHLNYASMVCIGVVVFLAGCGVSDKQDLSAWIQIERNSIKPSVKPIEEPKEFSPLPYLTTALLEPYADERLAKILSGGRTPAGGNSALFEAEERRRKQPLESFPLDAIAMVGSMERDGKPVALIKVNNLLHQVSQGNYMGQNYGLITSISENEVVLREIVQDSMGEWVERSASLQLQEEPSK